MTGGKKYDKHNTTQHNTTQHNTTQHNTTQHNTTQHNTTQHNTTQHNNIKDSLLIYKTKSFNNCYGKDAVIISYFFDYKITIEDKCGFPQTAYNKVINKLEEEKITYQIISKNENPIIKDYKNLNNYSKILSKAIDYVDFRNKKDWLKDRIDEISDIDTLERILKKISDELL